MRTPPWRGSGACAAISRSFAEREEDFPAQYTRSFEKVLDLSYGENPHQRAAYYAEAGTRTHLMSMVSKLHGKELSFNNLLDLDSVAADRGVRAPGGGDHQHNNPCGVAVGAGLGDAFDKALATDPQSAFGGVFCFNRPVGPSAGREAQRDLRGGRVRPGYDENALELLQQKPNTRLLENQERRTTPISEHDIKRVRGGILAQDRDTGLEQRDESSCDHPQAERGGMGRAAVLHACLQHVRSNAIVMSKGLGTVGIGAGQMSRVDSVRIAVEKAAAAGLALDGAAMASDVFFPFADGPQAAISRCAGRSSSRAGRSATTRLSRSVRPRVWRWCSRRDATSATEPWSFAPGASTSIEQTTTVDPGVGMREPHHPSCEELELPPYSTH